jgi:hypothetical protein
MKAKFVYATSSGDFSMKHKDPNMSGTQTKIAI